MPMRTALAALRQVNWEWEQEQAALVKGVAAWRNAPPAGPVFAAMARYGAGEALELCPPLAELFGPEMAPALAFAESFIAAGLAGINAHPLGHLPVAHGTRDAAPALTLAQSGRASLVLAAYDGAVLADLPAPKTAKFVPRETWIHVLAGSGTADLVLRRDGTGGRALLQSGRVELTPGMSFYRYGLREAMQVRSARGSLVLLRLQRGLGEGEPVREYSLPDGALVHQAAARPGDSRRELVISLLGRMKRKDALPRIMAVAADRDAGEGARWQAVREALVLDTQAGLDLLGQLVACADDPLSGPAASLQASLIQTWPVLREVTAWGE